MAVARCVRSGSPLRQPAPPAAPHRTALSGPARPGTMTVTRLDQGQRYRPRMAFLKKVRAEQRRETAAPLWASARHLGTAAGRGDALPGAPGWGGGGDDDDTRVRSILPGQGSPGLLWVCGVRGVTAPSVGIWGHDLLRSPVDPSWLRGFSWGAEEQCVLESWRK